MDNNRGHHYKTTIRMAVLCGLVALAAPHAAMAIVTATPPPGGYTQPLTSVTNGTSTTTTFNPTAGSSGSTSASTAASSAGSALSSALSSASFNVGPGGMVAGTCNSINGDITNVANLNAFQSSLIQVILEVGKVLNTGQMQQLQEQQTLDNQVLQEQTQSNNEEAVWNAQQTYASQVTGANAISNPCLDQSGATDLLNGMESAQQAAAASYSAAMAAEASVVNPLDSVGALAHATAPAWSAQSILPVGGATATAAAVSSAIANSVVPFPAMTPGAAAKKTPAGTNFQAVENIQKVRASLASEALAKIAQYNLPTVNGSALVNAWWAGMSGTPPGQGSNGDYSPDAMLQIATDARYANPQWYLNVQQHAETWNIKQYDKMMAIQLRVDYEQDQMLQRAVAIQAALLANQLAPDIAQLNNLRGQAMSEANGSLAGSVSAGSAP